MCLHFREVGKEKPINKNILPFSLVSDSAFPLALYMHQIWVLVNEAYNKANTTH